MTCLQSFRSHQRTHSAARCRPVVIAPAGHDPSQQNAMFTGRANTRYLSLGISLCLQTIMGFECAHAPKMLSILEFDAPILYPEVNRGGCTSGDHQSIESGKS
jgi:hypothetical protein